MYEVVSLAYPNILPCELYSDEEKAGEKFDTL